MTQKLDIVLFGATGFTGKHAIPFIEKFSKTKVRQLTWGIAGRSEEKLKTVLKDCEQKGISLGNIPIITADVENEQSLKTMARNTRIIINCCGPYNFYGEPVVKACLEEGTHYVDVSGEVQFLEKMQLKYNKKAEAKGVYIISACGFESIPVDLGIVYLQQNFTGTLNSVVVYMKFWETQSQSLQGTACNYGTWESMVHTLWNKKEIKEIRQQLFPNRLPTFKPQLQMKVYPHKPEIVEGWAFPLHTTDRSVVKRTQRLFYEHQSKRPVQVQSYFTIKSWLYAFIMYIGVLSTLILTKFSFAKKLLLEYPEIFSLGFISRKTPNEERIEKSQFKFTLYGQGWKKSLPKSNDQYTTPPDKAIVAEISGRNPGYGATNIMLVLAAITVITETDKMPPSGGVYPPGYAFANTSLLKQLKENDVNFEILYEKDL